MHARQVSFDHWRLSARLRCRELIAQRPQLYDDSIANEGVDRLLLHEVFEGVSHGRRIELPHQQRSQRLDVEFLQSLPIHIDRNLACTQLGPQPVTQIPQHVAQRVAIRFVREDARAHFRLGEMLHAPQCLLADQLIEHVLLCGHDGVDLRRRQRISGFHG